MEWKGGGEFEQGREEGGVGWGGGWLVKEGGNRVACRDKEVECCR